MKLNFWQWLGVLLLLVGALIYACDKGLLNCRQAATTSQPGQ